MQNLKDDGVQKTLACLWPELRPISSQKQTLIGHYRKVMTTEAVAKGDRAKGRAAKTARSCHTLFGEGAKIGPDLTGAQRTNLEYLLENIIDLEFQSRSRALHVDPRDERWSNDSGHCGVEKRANTGSCKRRPNASRAFGKADVESITEPGQC
ncbi:MAG: hypothetical protein U0744_09875 [Gemmataceae bacterium]